VRVELHADARIELRRAVLWYEERREGLGDDFVAEVSLALDRIRQAPDSYPSWPGLVGRTSRIRRFVLQKFPYVIAFEPHDDRILVLAIAHAKRRRSTG
jgi:toxin ParE1/3/4